MNFYLSYISIPSVILYFGIYLITLYYYSLQTLSNCNTAAVLQVNHHIITKIIHKNVMINKIINKFRNTASLPVIVLL